MVERIRVGRYKTVFKGRIFTVKQARAVLPDGSRRTYERAFRAPTVVILALDGKGRLLLTREYRLQQKRYLWRVPTGRVEPEENPRSAAQRELMEEAGFAAKGLRLFYRTGVTGSVEWIKYFYIATKLHKRKLDAGEYEDIKVVPTPLSKAYEMVVQGKIESESISLAIAKLYWRSQRQGFGL